MNYYLYLLAVLIELIFLFAIAVYAVGILYSGLMGAPYVPTSKKVIAEILKRSRLKKGQVFMELGSGDGRIVLEAIRQYGVHGIGIEINNLLVMLSRFHAKRRHIENVEFRVQNIFKADFGQADVIYMFLMPELMKKLDPIFREKAKKGTLLVSHGFRLPGWEKNKIDEIKTEPFSTFFYRI